MVKKVLFVLSIITITTINLLAQGQGTCYALTLPKEPLSEEEKQILIDMRQEEKLAHDVYYTLYSKWNVPIFNNISKSENVHATRMKQMLEKYDIKDPVSDLEIGKFADEKYQKLYDELVAKGSQSLKDALEVGATIEDLDIYDIDQALKKVDNEDIKLVLKNLRRGSTHHMRAFVRHLRNLGYDYTPQYISKEEFDKIMAWKPKGKRK